MLTTYYTLRCLVRELETGLPGRTIAGAFAQEKHRLHIAFREDEGHLIVDCTPMQSTLFLHPRASRARRNSVSLLPLLADRSIREVRLHPADRVVSLDFDGELRLHALLYGPKPNVLLTDASGTVRDAFTEARRHMNTPFLLPPAAEHPIDLDALSSGLAGGSGEAVRAILRTHLPAFGPDLLGETTARSGVNPAATAASLTTRDIDAVIGAVVAVLQELDAPAPRVYLDEHSDGAVAFSLIPLHLPGSVRERRFDDVHEAVRVFLSGRRTARAADTQKERIAATLSASCERARRTAAALEAELLTAGRAEEYERAGNLLLAHADRIPRGASAADLGDEGATMHITLDARRSAMQNAQRYFERARSARRARREAGDRLSSLKQKLHRGTVLLEELHLTGSPDEVRDFLRAHEAELPGFGISATGAPSPAPLFRIYRVEGGFEVLVGKNSANNDLLTLKHARPNDLWFHARGGSGSHVILRVDSARGEPGKAAREQAAALAAYFSSQKTSRMAPVAMTLRKYVRKPKGAAPGTVAIEREEVLFVTPSLPPGAAP